MWELSTLLKGSTLTDILQHTHAGLLYHAVMMLYGSLQGIESGAHLIVYLDAGLKANHFSEFRSATKGH